MRVRESKLGGESEGRSVSEGWNKCDGDVSEGRDDSYPGKKWELHCE